MPSQNWGQHDVRVFVVPVFVNHYLEVSWVIGLLPAIILHFFFRISSMKWTIQQANGVIPSSGQAHGPTMNGWWWLVAINLAFSQSYWESHHPNWRLEHQFYFPINLGNRLSSQLTTSIIFSEGWRKTTNQMNGLFHGSSSWNGGFWP